MAASDKPADESLYPIAVLIDELKNEDIQVSVWGEKNGDKILVIILMYITIVICVIGAFIFRLCSWQSQSQIMCCACGISDLKFVCHIVQWGRDLSMIVSFSRCDEFNDFLILYSRLFFNDLFFFSFDAC